MTITDIDREYMKMALKEARKALSRGDYPIGAVLLIDGKYVGIMGNSLHTGKDWISHAEADLLRKYSKIIKKNVKKNKSEIVLYTTLEPCLMCLGTCILNRISRIVYSCPDPHGGATRINPKELTEWYVRKWPQIEGGLYKEESYELMIEFMDMKNDDVWNKIKILFVKMHEKW